MRSDRLRGLTLGLALVPLSACEIEQVSIPRTEARLAMHSVLSASAASQVVLLERTRNGSVTFFAPSFDLADPIGSDAGIAESGADIRLVTPAGDTLAVREDFFAGGESKGQGIYRVQLPGSALVRNATYRLLVRTSKNEILSAETSVPTGTAAVTQQQRMFDRSRDTLVVAWPSAPGARSYFVRIETPFGPRTFFTDSNRVRLTGELRNTDVTVLPRVFMPGFDQVVTVSAVDSNYYDWYRTRNNRLSGVGLINRVSGGVGVFGSLVRLHFENVRVGTPQLERESGVFRFEGTPQERASTMLLSIELHVESRAARSDQGDALSGRYERRPFLGLKDPVINGLLGIKTGARVELALLRGWSAMDTVDVFTGQFRGDTLVGEYRFFGGPVRFVKQP